MDRPRITSSVSFLAGLTLVAFLLVVSVRTTQPGPRLSRTARLVDLIAEQDQRTSQLRQELDGLRAQLAALESSVAGREKSLGQLERQAAALTPFAGMAAIRGPGVRVELRDSTLRESPTGDPNDLVIHQQDIQAVVNALWASGAEGISINGERITALSAIRCVGNTLLLHGSAYSPPYVIYAIGDPARLRAGMESDEGAQRLQIVADTFRLGFAVSSLQRVSLPAFRGVTDMRYAKVGT